MSQNHREHALPAFLNPGSAGCITDWTHLRILPAPSVLIRMAHTGVQNPDADFMSFWWSYLDILDFQLLACAPDNSRLAIYGFACSRRRRHGATGGR